MSGAIIQCAALLFALGLSGCRGGSTAASGVPPRDATGAMVVEIATTDGFTFTPAHLTVPAGTRVRWTNNGPVPHTITSGASSRAADHPGALADHPLPSGAVFELTLTSAGDWPYFCRYHEGMGMTGLVTVTKAPVVGDRHPPDGAP
jgi:plastocyanin